MGDPWIAAELARLEALGHLKLEVLLVEVSVSERSGRRSASGELVEWVPAEYADALQGPRPVACVRRGGRSGRSGDGARRPAPRVIDELF
jgi:hypothetical protein